MENRLRAKVSVCFVFEDINRSVRLQWLSEGKTEEEVVAAATEQRDFLLAKFGNDVSANGFRIE